MSVNTEEANEFIKDQLPVLFGVEAVRRQQRLVQGRHPKSFKKESELWSYTKNATNRRDRIYKGHKFWNVIEEENIGSKLEKQISLPSFSVEDLGTRLDRLMGNGTQLNTDSAKNMFERQKTMPNLTIDTTGGEKSSKFPLSNPITDLATNNTKNIPKTKFHKKSKDKNVLADYNVDTKTRNQINFGMSFIIMNYNDEVLYINSFNEVRCKAAELIEPSDRIRFKLIDLLNPTNPGGLKFGDSLWLQCLENSETADNSFQAGFVLSTKVFNPPELKSVQFEYLHQEPPVDNNHSSITNGKPDHLKSHQEIENQTKVQDVDGDAQKAHPHHAIKQKSTIDSNHSLVPKKKKTESSGSEPATVCGDVRIIRIIELRRADQLAEGSLTDEKASRYNSKQATHLGKWSAHSALRPEDNTQSPADPYIYSLSPIFVQQDLYCLGTTQSSDHHTWPQNSRGASSKNLENVPNTDDLSQTFNDFFSSANSVVTGSSSKDEGSLAGNMENATDKSTSTSKLPTKKSGGMGGSKNAKETKRVRINENVQAFDEADSLLGEDVVSSYGCLRKVVKRGFPYDFSVDRKCVWKFCLLEQFSTGDLYALSDKDKVARQVMDTANMVLKMSQMSREGAKIHLKEDLVHGHPPLVGGETFPKMLRNIIFSRAQNLEDRFLEYQRIKELKLKAYFDHKISNVLEIADIVTSPGPKRKSVAVARKVSAKSIAELPGGSTFLSKSLSSVSVGHQVEGSAIEQPFQLSYSNSFITASSENPFEVKSFSTRNNDIIGKIQQKNAARKKGSPALAAIKPKPSTSDLNSRPWVDKEDVSSMGSGTYRPITAANAMDKIKLTSVEQALHDSLHHKRDLPILHNQPYHVPGVGLVGGSLNGSGDGPGPQLLAQASYSTFATYEGDETAPVHGVVPDVKQQTIPREDRYEPSELAKKIFQSNVKQLDPAMILLTSSEALSNYHKLSDGERILALHKTYEHLTMKTELSVSKTRHQDHHNAAGSSLASSGLTNNLSSMASPSQTALHPLNPSSIAPSNLLMNTPINALSETGSVPPINTLHRSGSLKMLSRNHHNSKEAMAAMEKKIDKLQQQDKQIEMVLHYQDRISQERDWAKYLKGSSE